LSDPLIVEATRGGIVESVHLGDLVVLDESGAIVASAGDPLTHAAFRSSSKPIQAGVCMELGWSPSSTEHLALACASHNGEPRHVAVAAEILAAAGLGAEALRTPFALPDASVPDAVAAAGRPAPIYHNCSGKHAAMLATCAGRGWPLESYREPQHPLQQAIHESIESLAGTLLDTATDGCGVVTFAAPLAVIARTFAAVTHTQPFVAAAGAMRAHPWLVAGTGRLCTAVLSALPDVTIKVGAEGLVCAAGPGFSLAVKARDGARRAQGPMVIEGLRRAGVLGDSLPESLADHARVPVTGGDRRAGEIGIRTIG
jgi:L-asparaginase II